MEAEVRDVVEEVRISLLYESRNLTSLLGERSCYELGTDHLPKCQRDGQQCHYT